MGTISADDFKIRDLYGICKSHNIKGFKRMTKREIFDLLKNKNLLPKNNLPYFVLWFSDRPLMYLFTSYYKGMKLRSYDEKMIKKYDSEFVWNETDNSPKTIYVTNSGRDKDPNVNFFGRFPSSKDEKFTII